MVGRINISGRADAVRHLFMDFEKNAKRIGTCCFCHSPWPQMKLANQGYLTGHHKSGCPFEELAAAAEQCIVLRDQGTQSEKGAAERLLTEKTDGLFAAMTEDVVADCIFPVCKYPHALGHRLECPFNRLRGARAEDSDCSLRYSA